jgi:Glycosyl transferase family 2
MTGLRTRARHAVDWRVRAIVERLEAAIGRTDAVAARVADLERAVAAVAGDVRALRERVDGELSPALRAVVSEEAANRRRLYAARREPGYAAAFEEAEPLVSIVIPTRDRPRLLVERAIASALAQTHRRIEVIVCGDATGPEVERAVRAVGDDRVRFAATTHRVADADAHRHWLVASTLARNMGYELARGSWLADLDDDDALRPGAVEGLLEQARAQRAEVVYGTLLQHLPDGGTTELGGFPPRFGHFGWQGAIVHGALRFFERELVAAAYGIAGDFFRLERMARVGVRIAHLPQVTADYFPSLAWEPDALARHVEQDRADAIDVEGAHPGVQRQREQ